MLFVAHAYTRWINFITNRNAFTDFHMFPEPSNDVSNIAAGRVKMEKDTPLAIPPHPLIRLIFALASLPLPSLSSLMLFGAHGLRKTLDSRTISAQSTVVVRCVARVSQLAVTVARSHRHHRAQLLVTSARKVDVRRQR